MIKRYINYIALIIVFAANAQGNFNPSNGFELGRLDYKLYPSIGDVQVENTSVALNFGKKISDKAILGFGLSYSNIHLHLKDWSSHNIYSDFERINVIRTNLIYKRNLKNNWSFDFLVAPAISSNLLGAITWNDVVFSSFSRFTKKWISDDELSSSLSFGLLFGTQLGSPRLLPSISYTKQISKKAHYVIGLPVTGFFYNLNEKNTFDFTVGPEGFFANNSNTLFNSNNVGIENSKVQFNSLKLSLGYHLKFNNNWITHFNLGYLPVSNLEIVDEDNNEVFDFEVNQSIFINIALSFNLNKKK